jgi:hypothetical protein
LINIDLGERVYPFADCSAVYFKLTCPIKILKKRLSDEEYEMAKKMSSEEIKGA